MANEAATLGGTPIISRSREVGLRDAERLLAFAHAVNAAGLFNEEQSARIVAAYASAVTRSRY